MDYKRCERCKQPLNSREQHLRYCNRCMKELRDVDHIQWTQSSLDELDIEKAIVYRTRTDGGE